MIEKEIHNEQALVGGRVVKIDKGVWSKSPFVNSIIVENNNKRYIIRRSDVHGFPPEDQIAIFEVID